MFLKFSNDLETALDRANVLCSRALRSAALIVRNSLTFAKIIEVTVNHGRTVKEHVRVCSVLDESKTLVRDPFDRTFSHRRNPILKKGFFLIPSASQRLATGINSTHHYFVRNDRFLVWLRDEKMFHKTICLSLLQMSRAESIYAKPLGRLQMLLFRLAALGLRATFPVSIFPGGDWAAAI